MGVALGLKLKTDRLDELINRFKLLDEAHVGFGMYDNTRKYDPVKGEYSDWTNVSLFRYLSDGNSKVGLVARPVLEVTMMHYPISKSPLKKELKTFLSKLSKTKGKGDVTKLLINVGEFYRDKAASLFGNTAYIERNTPYTDSWKQSKGYTKGNPLVATGDMRAHIAYKVNGITHEYGM